MDPLNEAGRLTPATEIADAARTGGVDCAQTKAGDYPRLRSGTVKTNQIAYIAAQRRPEITPGYERKVIPHLSDMGHAQRRPEITPGYEHPPRDPVVHAEIRSTKVGDYPRLRAAAPSALSGLGPGRSTKAGDYPRLRGHRTRPPSGSPGPLNEGRRLPPATRGPVGRRGPGRASRSTKAGDYPRLRGLIRGDGRFRAQNGFDHASRRYDSHGTDPILLNSWQFPTPHTPFPGCERDRPPESPEVRRSLR